MFYSIKYSFLVSHPLCDQQGSLFTIVCERMLALTTGLAALSLGEDESEGMNLYLGLLEQGGVEALALAHKYEERGGEWTAEEMAEARHLVTLVSERVPTSKIKTMEVQQQLYDAFQVILEANRAGDDFFMALLENYDPERYHLCLGASLHPAGRGDAPRPGDGQFLHPFGVQTPGWPGVESLTDGEGEGAVAFAWGNPRGSLQCDE
jgi:hypothetical protein